jgi:hypothetical protein
MTTRARSVVLIVALALAASLLALAVVLAKPAQAQADTFTDTDRSTFTFNTSSCTGDELVFIEGTVHTVAHTTVDANGGFHVKLQTNVEGQGEGLSSGDKYVFNSNFNFDQNSPTGADLNITRTDTFNLIRQGSATPTDDTQAKGVFHFTVNAQGEVTTFFDKFEFVCT